MLMFEAAAHISGERREALLAEARSNRLARLSRRSRSRRPAGGARTHVAPASGSFRTEPAPAAS